VPADATPADIRSRLLAPIKGRRLSRFIPSRRSLAIGAGIVALAACAYVIARETSLFAIERVDVTGGSAAVDRQVEQTLTPLVGKSLVGLSGSEVLQRVDALPTVVSATYDRAFPNTLRLKIVPEHPVAVLRDGGVAWVVSRRGRVMRSVDVHGASGLPRIWVAKTVRVGDVLPLAAGGTLTGALASAGPIRGRISSASFATGIIVFHLRSGIELVLGTPTDIALKVAVAVRLLRQIPAGTQSVDVSVPSRAVTSTQSISSSG
jgi:cell division protein FtsQ